MAFSENLKQIRIKKGLSQKEVAARLSVSQPSYAQYENGKRNPKLETVQKIADALGVSVTELAPELLGIRSINVEIIHNMELLLEQLPSMNLPKEVKEMHRQTAINEIKKRQEELEKMNLFFMSESGQRKLLTNFSVLNDNGKQKAIEQVELLTKIPEYRKAPEE